MTILDKYLNELFGFNSSLSTPEIEHGIKKRKYRYLLPEYESSKEKGEEICKKIESDYDEKIKKDFDKNCSKISDLHDKEICRVKNIIKYRKDLMFDLKKSNFLCNKNTVCFDVISKKIYDINKEIDKYENDLKNII